MITLLIVSGVVIVLSVLLGFFFKGGLPTDIIAKEKIPYQYKRRNFFMSRAEHECYDALIAAVGKDYYIFAQVHLSTLVDHTIRGQNWRAAFAHINGKSVDFVLCDKVNITPKLAIELDDRSHERPDRQERDWEVERILKEANVPLLRIENREAFDLADLVQKITTSMNKTGSNVVQ
jgi:very-short-patch-repair endonuclease